MTKNRLKGETSPYLLQHEDNPVHWWAWGDDAFAAAKKENKPVLLSIGYAACHWCHVMAHESFEDEATAALMNQLFINIKVDREERPDVDVIYQRAINIMGQQGGWPLTIFLDAEGHPFWGGTYFPDQPRQGMPAFRNVLEQISNAFQTSPEAIGKNRNALMESLERAWAGAAKENLKPSIFFGTAELINKNIDQEAGGMNGAPKFPNIPIMLPLWAACIRKGNNINIKVDREERPDVDVIYQRAINIMGQQGGWPLTIFLDAEGHPFWGGTYFPDQPRQGMPAFRNVLEQISNAFQTSPEAIGKNRNALMESLERAWAGAAKENLKPSIFFGTAELINKNIDQEAGGMNGAPKFPNIPIMLPLWAACIRKGNNNYKLSYDKTMTMICQGGIYDHLGGGFCRYSTDAYWLAPHFEKMLYDNALIIEGLVEIWKETKKPLYAARISETIGWLEREMKMPGGAFAASLDADSEGEEGKFYVWTLAEIQGVLAGGVEPLIQHYGVEAAGNWEGKTILHRLYHSEEFNETEEKNLGPLKTKLLEAREKRPRPFLDDKILADWNGLLISALASAGLAFKKSEWIKRAETAFEFISGTFQKDNCLYHSWRSNKLGPKAYLDDYAAMIRGATALYSATGNPNYLAAAEKWMAEAQQNLEDKTSGGFFLSPKQKPTPIARPKTIHDQATPSGNGLMIQNFSTLYHLTGKEVYREGAEALLATFASVARTSPFASGTYFSGFDAARYGAHLFIRGKRSAKSVQELLAVLNDLSFPGLVVQVEEKIFPLPAAKALKEGQAIVCQGITCSLPVSSPKDLKDLLLNLRQIKED